LLLALASPELEVVGISVVTGNTHVDVGGRHARAVLELVGRTDVPVYRGCVRPLLREWQNTKLTHGASGLGNAQLPEPTTLLAPRHAVDALVEAALADPGGLTLVAVAPLTNIALALRKEPEVARAFESVVVMGGAIRLPGNQTPLAEFNFAVDPHAARIVFEANLPVTIVPLDVTSQPYFTGEHVDRLTATSSRAGQLVADATEVYMRNRPERDGVRGCFMHDALAVATVVAPDLVSASPAHVAVESTGELTLGQCVADFTSPDPNARVALGVESERFLDLLVERLGRL
ncbi:MAG: nucleoside hydrolase, partial [Chloroflexi bacterium]|nr:nucleoside hydrolase [Chloroflexota bacterium]